MNSCILDQSKISSSDSDLSYSFEDLSFGSADEFQSSVNNSEDFSFSDDSDLAFRKTRIHGSQIDPAKNKLATSSLSVSDNPVNTNGSMLQRKRKTIRRENLEKQSFTDTSTKKPSSDCSSESYKMLNPDNLQYSCSSVIENVLKSSKVPNESVAKTSITLNADSDVWWSSDDDC